MHTKAVYAWFVSRIVAIVNAKEGCKYTVITCCVFAPFCIFSDAILNYLPVSISKISQLVGGGVGRRIENNKLFT